MSATPAPTPGSAQGSSRALWYPRFGRVDRFPSSCSALSALCQLEQIGVEPEDIRLILEGRRRQAGPPLLEQHPDPGTSVRHGVEVTLRLAEDSLLDRFPERAFVSLPGREGREQLTAARKLFAPFDKARLLALARLRHWNAVFSGAHRSAAYESFLYQVLGLPEPLLDAARRVFDQDQLRAWLRILPLLPRFAGDLGAGAEILAWFLGDRVTAGSDDLYTGPVPPGQRLALAPPSRAGGARGPGAAGGVRTASAGAPGRSRGGNSAAGARPPGAAGAPLGQGFIGRDQRELGTGVFFSIGPLTPERASRYAGLPLAALPGRGAEGHQVAVDLGFAGDLESLYASWESSRPALFATCWPQIIHILVHLIPAHMVVQVRLRPDAASGWRLGRHAAPPAAAPGDAAAVGATRDTGAAPPAGEPALQPSTLGAWTVLRNPQ
jgi:hypothetical protein